MPCDEVMQCLHYLVYCEELTWDKLHSDLDGTMKYNKQTEVEKRAHKCLPVPRSEHYDRPYTVRKFPPGGVSGHNSLPWALIGTRMGGNASDKPPGAP